MKKIDLDHDGVARKLKAAEYRGEPCRLDPFETEAVVDMLKELEALRAAIVSFAPCDCGEGCCVDPANCAVDRLRALTAAPVSAEPVATHRHKKRGSTYSLIGVGRMQAEGWEIREYGQTDEPVAGPSVDMEEVAIYRSVDDGSLWVRPRAEFEDGRFEPIAIDT